MTTTLQILKRGLLAGALLILGFGAGWASAIVLGGRIPLHADFAAYLGPGMGANRATPSELRDQFAVFWEVWNLVETEFYHRSPLDRQQMIQGAVKGMLESLGDQYTVYQEPDLAAQTQDHMQGKLGGIGTYLRIADGKAYIYKPIKNAPAVQAGLQQDDEIVSIDDVLVAPLIANLDMNQATVKVAAKLRGQPGTTVKLTLRRAAGNKVFDVVITRADIVIPSVDSQLLDGDLAYIHISEFKATTTSEFDAALRELLPHNPKGIILDLRNNPGGFLLNAQEVLGRLYDGVALYEDKNAAGLAELHTIAGSSDTRAFTTPLVVLVNGGSASASEIVAGALHDTRAATYLIGEKTFGKGSVQNIHTLSDGGSARITIAHWLTPNKSEIHKLGITPQYLVPYTEDSASTVPCVADRQPPSGQATCADSQLASAIKLLSTGQAPPTMAAPAAAK
ncbi:MAG TPA: S41 family peptidase [Roseiflexaceae bacterium]|nr:S41 family peptidase [Roseiflexaceae bacterium]